LPNKDENKIEKKKRPLTLDEKAQSYINKVKVKS